MWFRFPHGTTSASFHQQNFEVEHEAEVEEVGTDGKPLVRKFGFFRAPEHFAPTILAIPGFRQTAQPEGAPEDLTPTDPGAASTIATVTAQMSALRDENESLRNQLAEAAGMLRDYQQKLKAASEQIASLQSAGDEGADAKKK